VKNEDRRKGFPLKEQKSAERTGNEEAVLRKTPHLGIRELVDGTVKSDGAKIFSDHLLVEGQGVIDHEIDGEAILHFFAGGRP